MIELRSKTVDVFIRQGHNYTPLRHAMLIATIERWTLDPLASVRHPHLYGIHDPIEVRRFAEMAADSDPYIICDDDILIWGKDWVKRGLEAMEHHPEYGICSTLSLVEGENQATGQGEIYPMHSVGQPMWVRKGICTEIPKDTTFTYECQVIHKLCERKGFKMGIISGIRHNHIGSGFSNQPEHRWGV
jgi:hypothetical protein